jgi:hypothetical protein
MGVVYLFYIPHFDVFLICLFLCLFLIVCLVDI